MVGNDESRVELMVSTNRAGDGYIGAGHLSLACTSENLSGRLDDSHRSGHGDGVRALGSPRGIDDDSLGAEVEGPAGKKRWRLTSSAETGCLNHVEFHT